MEIAIREMSIDDLKSINALSHQLGYDLSLAETKAQIEKVLSKEDHIVYVAALQNKTVGWVHAFVSVAIESKSFVEIGGLVVDEDHRGKGIGNKLVKKVKAWAVCKKISLLRVRSNATRIHTHHFYNKVGFKEIKQQKVFSLNMDE